MAAETPVRLLAATEEKAAASARATTWLALRWEADATLKKQLDGMLWRLMAFESYQTASAQRLIDEIHVFVAHRADALENLHRQLLAKQ